MSAIETGSPEQADVAVLMAEIGERAKASTHALATADAERKHAALSGAADALQGAESEILAANAIDMEAGRARGLGAGLLDRLALNPERIRAIVDSIRTIAELPDPVGERLAEWDVASGLHIERVRTPLGVIGIIYESRPNVTADAGALCVKSGNASILRAGSDSFHSSRAIHRAMVKGLEQAGLPADGFQLVPTTDRGAVGEMLKGLNGTIDVIVPRGGAGLVARVQHEARVPVFAHLEGICHVFVDESAQLDMAVGIVLNSKMRRTSICGAAETLLVHEKAARSHLPAILGALTAAGCEVRADPAVRELVPGLVPVREEDWRTEYNDAVISVGIVRDVEAAIEHIETYSSHHTEAIISEDQHSVDRFFAGIDSAILLHNASTQFADGGEFGMGAEIGIATGKMHARGPVGVEQLTSFKYLVHGTGQVRP